MDRGRDAKGVALTDTLGGGHWYSGLHPSAGWAGTHEPEPAHAARLRAQSRWDGLATIGPGLRPLGLSRPGPPDASQAERDASRVGCCSAPAVEGEPCRKCSEDGAKQDLRHAAEPGPCLKDLAHAAGRQDDGTVDHKPDQVEHGGQHHDLHRNRAFAGTNELREQCKHEQRHLGVEQVGNEALAEHLADGIPGQPRRWRQRRPVAAESLADQEQQVGRAHVACGVVGERHGQEQLRQPEGSCEPMEVCASLDAGQRGEAGGAALGDAAGQDQQHVKAGCHRESQAGSREQGKGRGIEHTGLLDWQAGNPRRHLVHTGWNHTRDSCPAEQASKLHGAACLCWATNPKFFLPAVG